MDDSGWNAKLGERNKIETLKLFQFEVAVLMYFFDRSFQVVENLPFPNKIAILQLLLFKSLMLLMFNWSFHFIFWLILSVLFVIFCKNSYTQ